MSIFNMNLLNMKNIYLYNNIKLHYIHTINYRTSKFTINPNELSTWHMNIINIC